MAVYARPRMTEVSRQARRIRRPSHSFQLRSRPWQIQPFLLAPVLPGETMRNLLLQARVVTDPIKNPLIGWWAEYYVFYVRHSDLDARDDLASMVLDPEHDMSGLFQSARPDLYHFGGTLPWAEWCLERVTDCYFRSEDETAEDFKIGDLPSAQIMQRSWLDSVTNDADMEPVPDVDVDLNQDSTITAREVDVALRHWQMMQQGGLTDMTYEDFLRSYGVNIPEEPEAHKPELVRYLRDWTYPTNHVDPSTGTPSSACSWAIAERADKDRFCPEPGFIFGVSVVRPKVYLGGQRGSAAGLLRTAHTWLPAVLRGDIEHAWTHLAEETGPLPGNDDEGGYWADVRDLFVYGDQFCNFDMSSAVGAGLVELPTAGLQKRYPSASDADGLFSGTNKTVRQDGVCNLMIASVIRDLTPQT